MNNKNEIKKIIDLYYFQMKAEFPQAYNKCKEQHKELISWLEALSLVEKNFERKVKDSFEDMEFVENVIKPEIDNYYKKQGKSTKGELLLINAQLKAEIERLKRQINCVKDHPEIKPLNCCWMADSLELREQKKENRT